jgi:uncharacterized protein Smg (DUF494 family)
MAVDKRIMEVINYISDNFLKKLEARESDKISGGELIEDLIKMGYKLFEINQAFELIFSLPDIITPEEGEKAIKDLSKAMRVLSYMERFKLSLDAQGFLLQSRDLGLLTAEEFEDIVAQAMRSDSGEIGLGEIKWIMSKIVDDSERLMLINATNKTTNSESALIN